MYRHSGAAMILILLFAVACEQPVQQPDAEASASAASAASTDLEIEAETPAARQLVAFINAVRTGERTRIESLIEEHMAGFLSEIPMEEHVDELMGFHEGFSNISFYEYSRNEQHAAQGLFHNGLTDSWVKIGVEVEKEPPHRIVTIGLEPASSPESSPGSAPEHATEEGE